MGSVVLQNAPGNQQMIAPSIQKDIIHACAKEITNSIIDDLGHDLFGIPVDESRDISHKEQMAFVLCYSDKRGL